MGGTTLEYMARQLVEELIHLPVMGASDDNADGHALARADAKLKAIKLILEA